MEGPVTGNKATKRREKENPIRNRAIDSAPARANTRTDRRRRRVQGRNEKNGRTIQTRPVMSDVADAAPLSSATKVRSDDVAGRAAGCPAFGADKCNEASVQFVTKRGRGI